MKTQPICIIYFPKDFSFGEGELHVRPLDLMKEFNGWINPNPKEPLGGYLWFCFFKDNITEPEFKVFHEKDFTKIQYLELKQLIEDSLKQQSCNTN
jgi:hypothetical protein